MQVENPKQPKIINQGSYGCIFRPGFSCQGKPLNQDKYITKIQKKRRKFNNRKGNRRKDNEAKKLR